MVEKSPAALRLPTGTVTFLFTDIEGSTRLWEQYRAAMGAALAHHDVVLRAAIRDHDGYVFATGGDAFCAAFHTAADGLEAARDAQLALARDTWPAPVRIKVRMALHTGTAELRDNDYFGAPLNRVARLLAAGHGGQVLLSLAAQELVRDALPDGVTLRDMGERRLKDLIRPEHVYQLVAPNLPQDFPPLRTLDARTHNLPIQLTSFLGRDREMQEVGTLLRDARLVTLTGAGGAGKTRLSLQVGADLIDGFGAGVWFVELAPLTESNLVPQALATVLGVKEQPGRSVTEALVEYLKDQQVLVLLDNCEHLVEASAQLCATLLAACAELRILATSREALRVPGERPYRVPSLATPDVRAAATVETLTPYAAVQLFIDRAVTVKSDFRVDNRNAPAVASICHHLDGIPLAIELAAARLRSMAVEEVNQRLDHRFRLLTGGARTAMARQRTLRATIDWSYDLLPGIEQALFRRLAVFASGWTLGAAERVCSGEGVDEEHVLDLLTALTDKSLALAEERSGDIRYRLLETVRQYARDRLRDRDEEARWQERHLAYFTALAEEAEPELIGANQQAWLDRLETEHDDLRSSLTWSLTLDGHLADGLRLAGALARFWELHGYLDEGRGRLAALLAAAPDDQAPAARAKGLKAAGLLAFGQCDYPAARTFFEESLSLSRELGNRRGIDVSLHNLGAVAQAQGDYGAARALYEESLAISRERGDRHGMGASLDNLANVAYSQGDYAAARTLGEESLSIARDEGDRREIAASLRNLAEVAFAIGDYPRARVLSEESLAIERQLGHRQGIAYSLNGLGLVATEQGDYAAASAFHDESLATSREVGDRWGIAWSLEGLAYVAVGLARPDRAARLWGAMERLREEIGAPLQLSERPRYERQVAAARAAIGDAAFSLAWQEGRAMSLEQVFDYALRKAPGT